MENRMTIEDVLRVTAEMLEEIQVPVKWTRQIGEPISSAAENLRECLKAIAKDREEKALTEAEEDADVQREL